jgi:hypothetical protein
MSQVDPDKIVEALDLFCGAMENAVAVLKGELKKVIRPPPSEEASFNILRWESGESERLGKFETAYKASNLPDKFQHAFNILRANNATIKKHYGPEEFQHYYWLYLEKYDDRIFRKQRETKDPAK